jgi:transcriptional regulator with XRE-family HTH domain
MVERILNLMKERDVTAAQLTREIALTNGLVSQWKKGLQNPSTEAVIKIADYFGVTTDWLLTGKEPVKKNVDEMSMSELIKNNSELTEEGKKLLMNHYMLIKSYETARAEREELAAEFSASDSRVLKGYV